MNQTAIFWPMFAHVALIYGVYFLISKRRIEAIKAGSAKSSRFRENLVEPPESRFVRNNLANQFELPVLFYTLCIALFVTNGVTLFAVTLAWLFVASRYIHCRIHTTTNRIRHRRPIFIIGWLLIGVMWVIFALQIAGVA